RACTEARGAVTAPRSSARSPTRSPPKMQRSAQPEPRLGLQRLDAVLLQPVTDPSRPRRSQRSISNPACPPACACAASSRAWASRSDPLVQAHPANSKGIVHALAGTGDEAIERHRDPEAQL